MITPPPFSLESPSVRPVSRGRQDWRQLVQVSPTLTGVAESVPPHSPLPPSGVSWSTPLPGSGSGGTQSTSRWSIRAGKSRGHGGLSHRQAPPFLLQAANNSPISDPLPDAVLTDMCLNMHLFLRFWDGFPTLTLENPSPNTAWVHPCSSSSTGEEGAFPEDWVGLGGPQRRLGAAN